MLLEMSADLEEEDCRDRQSTSADITAAVGAGEDHVTLCVGCGDVIRDQYVLRVSPDLEWHAACLRCDACGQNLNERCTCFVRDGKTYCRVDYTRLFGVKCSTCSGSFESDDLVMRARHHVYHVNCFRCHGCSRPLVAGDEFALRDDALFCRQHFHHSLLPLLPSFHPSLTPGGGRLTPMDDVMGIQGGQGGVRLREMESIKGEIDDVFGNESIDVSFYNNNNNNNNSSGSSDSNVVIDDGSSTGLPTALRHSRLLDDNNSTRTNLPDDTASLHVTGTRRLTSPLAGVGATGVGVGGPGGHTLPSSISRKHGEYTGGEGGRQSGGGGGGSRGSKNHHHHKNAPSDHKTTRIRTVLNEKQLHTLRTCYGANPRPDALMKDQLVEMTGLSSRVIRVWFQNKRCKDKKRTILIKQIQQHHHDKSQGVPMIASSPVQLHDSSSLSLMSQGHSIEIHQYLQQQPQPQQQQQQQQQQQSTSNACISTWTDYSPLTHSLGSATTDQAPFQQLLNSFGGHIINVSSTPLISLPREGDTDDVDDDDDDTIVSLDEHIPASGGSRNSRHRSAHMKRAAVQGEGGVGRRGAGEALGEGGGVGRALFYRPPPGTGGGGCFNGIQRGGILQTCGGRTTSSFLCSSDG